MPVKGVESRTGVTAEEDEEEERSKTRKLQFIHQSFDWTRLRRPRQSEEEIEGEKEEEEENERERDTEENQCIFTSRRCVTYDTRAKCLANPGRRIPSVHCTLEN